MRKPIIADKKTYDAKFTDFCRAGAEKLYILTDFDNTLTHEFWNGEHTPSLIGEISKGQYISKRHTQEDARLYNIYRPKERDPQLSIEEKTAWMVEWWNAHMQVMIEEGAREEMFVKAAVESNHLFRARTDELLRITNELGIPFVIFSAGFRRMIEALLDSIDTPTTHTAVVSNELAFDKNGVLTGYAKEPIHVFNKNTISPERNAGLSDMLSGKTHVIVMGDSIGDLPMMERFPHEHVLKIGFYNHEDESILDHYTEQFDIVILDEADMSLPLQLVSDIVKA